MNKPARIVAMAGALLCLSAVILGALGSHLINMNGMQGIWETASDIHLFNAAALIGLAALLSFTNSRLLKWGSWLIILGTVLFSGSIYLHVITGYKFSILAPSGGILMMTGWLVAVLVFFRKT